MSCCKNCKSKALTTDPHTGNLECTSCGVVQHSTTYDQQTYNRDGPTGHNIRLGTSGSRYDYSYHETKIYLAQKIVSDILLKLELENRFDEVNNMIKEITDNEYGSGRWFSVLVGACVYVVMRKAKKWMPLGSICENVGCDGYELGRMVSRVVEHLEIRLPDGDIVGLFERVVKEMGVGREKVGRVLKQGVFLLQCMVKWYVTTGRRPVPVVVAVVVFVCEVNEVEVSVEDLAEKLNVNVTTCKLRYKEVLERLVDVGRGNLPWGENVNVKNVMKNAPMIIQYMEMKSMCSGGGRKKDVSLVEGVGLVLDGLIKDCLDGGDDGRFFAEGFYAGDDDGDRSRGGRVNWEVEDLEKLKVSHECLSKIYLKFLDEYTSMKASMGTVERVGSGKSFLFLDMPEYWTGNSEMSKKLFLDQILEKDVGLNVMPPSFVKGCLKTKRRKEKIKAAKIRIEKIRRPWMTANDSDELCVQNAVISKKRKKRAKKADTDWEDFVIETLLLHQVKEEEIEKGYYNTLLDLHVVNSAFR
uniref:plant-specific TFIIB-related protein PTF2 n=1 Tax=Erigeron canadensis TaxID=72917 RepID=UPI001CB93F09|nr:plant-specific TFIIB-related protein PTF2 [Erigeron canadensis]